MCAVLLLDTDGKRILAQYYKSNFTTTAEEMAFEKKLSDKTMRTNAKTEGAFYFLCLPPEGGAAHSPSGNKAISVVRAFDCSHTGARLSSSLLPPPSSLPSLVHVVVTSRQPRSSSSTALSRSTATAPTFGCTL